MSIDSDEKGVIQPTAEEQQAIDRYMTPPPPHNTLMLSELPEPPIPLNEIGPIPPPPMFSSPSPTTLARQRQQQLPLSDCEDDGKFDYMKKIEKKLLIIILLIFIIY